MKNICLLLILLLSSCASSTTKDSSNGSSTSEDFSWIENSDFLPTKEISYSPSRDKFTSDVRSVDSISVESISRVPAPRLMSVVEEDSPISQMIGNCYQKKFDKAFSIMDKHYQKYKTHPAFWNQVGTCFLLKGEIRKSILYYNKSIAVKRDYGPAINNLGVLYLREGREQKALAAFQKAADVNSFSVTPIFNMSHLYLKYGLVDDARELLVALFRRNNSDQDVLTGLGTVYLMQGKAKDAVNVFSRLEESTLRNANSAINYAIALKAIGRVVDAKTILNNIDRKTLGGMSEYYSKVGSYIGL